MKLVVFTGHFLNNKEKTSGSKIQICIKSMQTFLISSLEHRTFSLASQHFKEQAWPVPLRVCQANLSPKQEGRMKTLVPLTNCLGMPSTG